MSDEELIGIKILRIGEGRVWTTYSILGPTAQLKEKKVWNKLPGTLGVGELMAFRCWFA